MPGPSRATLRATVFSPPVTSTSLTKDANKSAARPKKKGKAKDISDVASADDDTTPTAAVATLPASASASPPRKKQKSRASDSHSLPFEPPQPASSVGRSELGKPPESAEEAKSKKASTRVGDTEAKKAEKKKRNAGESASSAKGGTDGVRATPTSKKSIKRKVDSSEDTRPVATLSGLTTAETPRPSESQQATAGIFAAITAEEPVRKKKKQVAFEGEDLSPAKGKGKGKGKQRAEIVVKPSDATHEATLAEATAAAQVKGKAKVRRKSDASTQDVAQDDSITRHDVEEAQATQKEKQKKSRKQTSAADLPPVPQTPSVPQMSSILHTAPAVSQPKRTSGDRVNVGNDSEPVEKPDRKLRKAKSQPPTEEMSPQPSLGPGILTKDVKKTKGTEKDDSSMLESPKASARSTASAGHAGWSPLLMFFLHFR